MFNSLLWVAWVAAVPVMACVNGGHCFPLGTAVAIPATHVSFQIRSSCQRHVSAHIQQLVFGRMCVSRLAIVFPLLYFFLVSPSLPRIVLPVSSSPPASWTDTAAASPATSSAAAAAAAAATTTTTTTTNTTTTNCSYAQDHHTCHQDRGLQLLNTAPARRLRSAGASGHHISCGAIAAQPEMYHMLLDACQTATTLPKLKLRTGYLKTSYSLHCTPSYGLTIYI